MRNCNGCSLCCRLIAIETLNKPQYQWCDHCEPKKGCKIYDSKPSECTEFNCAYLLNPKIGEEWRPNKCKMVIIEQINRTMFFVDDNYPNAWKKEPFYSRIKDMARQFYPQKKQVTVSVGKKHIYVILPDKDIDLGEVKDHELITLDGRKISAN